MSCAHTSWYRQDHRQLHTLARQSHLYIHQCHRVSMVVKLEVQVLFVLFERCDIHLIPLASTCLLGCTYCPIKWSSCHTRISITHTYGNGHVSFSGQTDIYILAVHHIQHTALDLLHESLTSSHIELLGYHALNWSIKCHINFQASISSTSVSYVELSSIATTSNQVLAQRLIYYARAREESNILVEYQLRRIKEVIILTWSRCNNHLFLHAQCQSAVSSQLEEYIVFFENIQEYATKLIFLLVTSSNHPIFLDYGTCRAVKTKVKCYVCRSRTIVLNNKLKFLVCVLDVAEVHAIPLLTSRNRLTCPVEVNRFRTSIIYNFLSLIHFS